MTETAVWVGVALLVLVAVFQLALAVGVPWGAAAWGGRIAGTLPAGFRLASALAGVVIYPLIILTLLVSAGVVEADWWPLHGPAAMWALTAFFALGAIVNAVSPSRPERFWAPVSLVLAVCCGLVAAIQ